MIGSSPLYPPTPAYPSGVQNPQPDGTFTLIANDDTGAVFSVVTPTGGLTQQPKGTAGPNEKFTLNPGGATISAYIGGIEYCYAYDGRVA